jgi:hypothetical protein
MSDGACRSVPRQNAAGEKKLVIVVLPDSGRNNLGGLYQIPAWPWTRHGHTQIAVEGPGPFVATPDMGSSREDAVE